MEGAILDISILTLFPEMFTGPFTESILKKSQDKGLVNIVLWNIRDFSDQPHRVVDDAPFGGGPGMVMKIEPIYAAIDHVKKDIAHRLGSKYSENTPVILLSPQGELFDQKMAGQLAATPSLIVICGHYEGIDARVEQSLVNKTISIGDYVLTGGELPAMVLVDAVVRLIPGVLGDSESNRRDSFSDGILQAPQYTRPFEFRGLTVPEILRSGDHAAIVNWRRRQALGNTLSKRADLLETADLTAEDRIVLSELQADQSS